MHKRVIDRRFFISTEGLVEKGYERGLLARESRGCAERLVAMRE
jgi:hypothetical protein